MNETPLDELARRVNRARRALHGTVEVARVAEDKISRGAWDNVEKGRPAKQQTYDSIEKALRWEPGTIDLILAGTYEEQTEVPDELANAIKELESSTISAEARRVILASLPIGGSKPNEDDTSATTA